MQYLVYCGRQRAQRKMSCSLFCLLGRVLLDVITKNWSFAINLDFWQARLPHFEGAECQNCNLTLDWSLDWRCLSIHVKER